MLDEHPTEPAHGALSSGTESHGEMVGDRFGRVFRGIGHLPLRECHSISSHRLDVPIVV
jgi:hypothetical protein